MGTDIKMLVVKAKTGDAKAFSELYATYANELYRFAYCYLSSNEDAQDAVQDAVCIAYRTIPSLRKEYAFKSWIFKILSNECNKYIKQQIEKRKTIQFDVAEKALYGETLGMGDISTEMKDALKLLREDERKILLLSVVCGYKSNEISKMLDCSSGTVRSKLSRSLEKLRKIVTLD